MVLMLLLVVPGKGGGDWWGMWRTGGVVGGMWWRTGVMVWDVSFVQKHKKHKNTILNKIKKNSAELLHYEISNHR